MVVIFTYFQKKKKKFLLFCKLSSTSQIYRFYLEIFCNVFLFLAKEYFCSRSINGEEVQLLLKTADGKLMQLSATPISEEPTNVLNVTTKQQTVVIKTEPSLRCAEKLDPKKSVITRLSLAKLVSYI